MNHKVTRILSMLALSAVLSFSAYPYGSFAMQKREKQRTAPVGRAGQLTVLQNTHQLKEAFQRDVGKVRFVTILSPT